MILALLSIILIGWLLLGSLKIVVGVLFYVIVALILVGIATEVVRVINSRR